MATIDLNADLGESTPERVVSDDAAMLGIVSSANVSCGFHAGSPAGIKATLRDAVAHGVTIGAHPGYDDHEGFGRRIVEVDDATLQAQVEYQLGALQGLAAAVGATVAYVKPHGALYNAMAADAGLASLVAAAVRAVDDRLTMLCLAGSVACGAVEAAGLRVVREAFADRAYTPDGHLVPRTVEGAVLHDADVVAARMLRLATERTVTAIDGTAVRVDAESICVHGDSAGAIAMAAVTRSTLEAHGIGIEPFAA